MIKPPHILLLSDFNIQNLSRFLKKEISGCTITEVPYGQLAQVVLQPGHAIWEKKYDFIVIWANPGALASSFPKVMAINELEQFVSRISQLSIPSQQILIVDFDLPGNFTGFTSQDEVTRIYEMNLLLRKHFQCVSPQPWLLQAGVNARDDKMWYLSKTPFHKEVFHHAAKAFASYWNGWQGISKKLLILDLDDTLWGGIVGDDGWQNLQLGGHDGVGEAFVDFQKEIKKLKEKGVMLAIVSKNDEEIALYALEHHPEMILKKEDFSGWKINWNDKAENISLLVRELNIGIDSVVFLDDNPVERERVKMALPQVLVPELPEDKLLYPSFFKNLDMFNTPAMTEEDTRRAELYHQEKARTDEKIAFASVDEWLESLQTKAVVEALKPENLVRAAQLLNKTNQMNLRTRRMSEEELWNWANKEGHHFFTIRVEDKFGSAGLTGLVGFSDKNDHIFVEDFVLSCRVMGRKVEEAMVSFMCDRAKLLGYENIVAELVPTNKNKPCKEFWSKGFNENEFQYIISSKYDKPESIEITVI